MSTIPRQERHPVYPDALREDELQHVHARRQRAGCNTTLAHSDNVFVANGVGLSGGGIRSATFALGLSQALAQARLWAKVDFLSTVSGGGYFGAFLGRLFQQQGSVSDTEKALQQGKGVHHLRLFGRYLAPGGRDDAWAAAAQMLRNLFFLQALFFFFAVAGATLAVLLTHIARDWTVVQAFGRHLPPVFFPATLLVLPLLFTSLFYFSLSVNGGDFSRTAVRDSGLKTFAYFILRSVMTLCFSVLLLAPLAAVGEQSRLGLQHVSQLMLSGFAPALFIFMALATGFYWLPQNEWVVSSWRMRATRSLRWLLLLWVICAVAAGLDYLAFQCLSFIKKLSPDAIKPLLMQGISALLGGNILITLSQRVLQSLNAKTDSSHRWSAILLTFVVAAIAGAILFCFILIAFICAHAVSFNQHNEWSLHYWRLLGLCALALVAVGSLSTLANYTSMHGFYFSRLKRAWLRAATCDKAPDRVATLNDSQIDDDVAIADYTPQSAGGPLHLINCTINETVGQDTGLYQADRRGLALCVSAHVVSVGARHHLLRPWQDSCAFSRFQLFGASHQLGPDGLTLGRWVAISGAAFSTGLGQATRWYYALIAASLNVRLGFWWRARKNAALSVFKPRLPWQLLQESFGMFRGTGDAHWYLSDGGHFENMAGYELIRRRLSRIVIVDAECDGDYQFGGMANLVHKARLDFGAEIRFLSDDEIAQSFGGAWQKKVGSLTALSKNGREGGAGVRAAIARVIYHDNDEAFDTVLARNAHWLLYIKPVVTGAESLDITQYKNENVSFPQQTTIDQFFDERQWEAYRKLGEITGTELAALIDEFLVD